MGAMTAAFIWGGVCCRGTVPNAAACGPCGCHRYTRVIMIQEATTLVHIHFGGDQRRLQLQQQKRQQHAALITCTMARILLQEPRP